MNRYGYIRDKDDIKFLILYVMTFLTEPVLFENLADMALCDGGFGYLEFADAAGELVKSSHIVSEERDDGDFYSITEKGRATAAAFEKQLPGMVRAAAQRSALRVVRELRRNATIDTRTVIRKDGTKAVCLSVMGGDVPVFHIELMVMNDTQADMLIGNFKRHAEQVYSGMMSVLLNDYTSTEGLPIKGWQD